MELEEVWKEKKVAAVAGAEPDSSQQPELLGLPHWVKGTKHLGHTAFPGTLGGTWIRNGAAGT